MLFSKRILVVLDSGPNSQNALVRASLIAARTGCGVELIWAGKSEPWQGLEELIEALKRQSAHCSQHLLKGSLVQMIRKRWSQDHFGLLVKACDARHDKLSLLAPRDWKILRETPCPVLLVKQKTSWENTRILAAINPGLAKSDSHNQSILMLAGFIAREVNAQLHAVIATRPVMQGDESELQSQATIEHQARRALEVELKQMCLPVNQIHIGEGPPEHLIPLVSTHIKAGLLVMGTHARKGVSAALLGNTAERILDRIDTDILVLRTDLSEPLDPLINP
ncbi:MAG: universal stress protein [Pontibacterium sp.]